MANKEQLSALMDGDLSEIEVLNEQERIPLCRIPGRVTI
jgi:hypothetical protein